MINWKIIAGFAAFAFLVTFITGIFSGVAFLELFLRALLWAILFGGLGFGILVIVNRFLPDLADAFGSNTVVDKSESGEEVDIMLPDENPHKVRAEEDFIDEIEAANDNDAAEEEFSNNQLIKDEDDDVKLGDDTANEEISGEIGDDGLEEIPARATKGKNRQKDKSSADDLETLEEIGDNSFSEINELDSLPDLDKFSGAFSGFDDFDASTSEGVVFKSKENVEISGVKQDPSKVAKAIHTWIERDKEG